MDEKWIHKALRGIDQVNEEVSEDFINDDRALEIFKIATLLRLTDLLEKMAKPGENTSSK